MQEASAPPCALIHPSAWKYLYENVKPQSGGRKTRRYRPPLLRMAPGRTIPRTATTA
jgi:hypothetical protein